MAALTLTWLPAPKPPHTLFSRRHTLRLTRITRTRFVSRFNDSRGAAVNQFSGVSCSTDGGATFTRVTNAAVKVLSPIPLVTLLFCITSRPRHGLPCGWMGTEAALWAGTSRVILRIQIAGPISAFTPTAATTGNLAGRTTILPLRHFGQHVCFMEQLQCWQRRSPGHLLH